MSTYHLDRIATILKDRFHGLIDMSDFAARSEDEGESAFLQRALAALCIRAYSGVDDARAANSLVDGWDDGGVDAILFDQIGSAFYLVQAKWNKRGNKTIDHGDCAKFLKGAQNILSNRVDFLNNV